jgi:hypothetical protein
MDAILTDTLSAKFMQNPAKSKTCGVFCFGVRESTPTIIFFGSYWRRTLKEKDPSGDPSIYGKSTD